MAASLPHASQAADAQAFAKARVPVAAVLAAARLPPAALDAPICKPVWQADGYVCDAGAIKLFAAADQVLLADGQKAFADALDLLRDIRKLFMLKFARFSNCDVDKRMKKFLNDDSTPKESEKDNAKRCWDHMGKLRKSSLCYICSAVNYKYYLSDKGLVPIEDCRLYIDQCYPHFRTIGEILLSFNNMESFFALDADLAHKAFADQIYKAVFLANDWLPLMDYSNSVNQNADKAKARVCEYTLRLSSKPTALQVIIDKLIAGLRLVKDYLEKIAAPPAAAPTSPIAAPTAAPPKSTPATTKPSTPSTPPAAASTPAATPPTTKPTPPARTKQPAQPRRLASNWAAPRRLSGDLTPAQDGVFVTSFLDGALVLVDAGLAVVPDSSFNRAMNLSLLFH